LTEDILAEPVADAFGQFFPAIPAVGQSARSPVFVADARGGPDLLDMAEALAPIAEACAHRDTQTPLMIGIVGPPGSGKSFALERAVAAVDDLANASSRAPGGPFLSRIVVVPIDAAAISGDPASAIAAAVFAELGRDHGGIHYSALADEAAHASADPYQAANKALERHDETRRRLDAERQARDDVEARRARLIETVLFETAGSRIDAYARSRRGPIEARLRRFDLASGDATVNFRNLVRDLAGAGWGSRIGVILGSIWAYRSQRRLLLAAIVLLALAFGITELRGQPASNWPRGLGPPFPIVADWLDAHAVLIGNLVVGLVALGLIALAVNLWRALLFIAMLFRGVGLLNYDARERQRDLDAASARLNRRILALTAETEAAARHAEAAEKRAHARGEAPARAPGPAFTEPALAGPSAARAFLAALSKIIASQAERAPPAPASMAPPVVSVRAVLGPVAALPAVPAAILAAPERILIAFDNLDALPPAEALHLIETAHSLLGLSFVAALACDAAGLAPVAASGGSLRGRLDKLFQLTFNARLAGAANGAQLIGRLIDADGAPRPAAPAIEAGKSRLSEPLSAAEAKLLAALSPLAAGTPRGVKRFLNAYRLARVAKASRPALALMLALGQSGDDEAMAGMDPLLAAKEGLLADPDGPPALLAAVRAARTASEGVLTVSDAIAARDLARRYQLLA
jgi:hypothetical protein